MTVRTLLAVAIAISMTVGVVAQNAQGEQGKQDIQAVPVVNDSKKNKIDHSTRIEATIGVECDETTAQPIADGSIRLSGEYGKTIMAIAELDIDKSKIDVDSLVIRWEKDRLGVLVDYGKEKPYADDLARSDERPLAGKSSLASYVGESGYGTRSIGVGMDYAGDKKSPLRGAAFGVSYDSEYSLSVSGGFAFRAFNERTFVGASGTLFAPSIRGYGTVFANVDLDWLLFNARCAAGTYLSALDSISIDGILYSSPGWGCADAGLGYRARFSGATCEIWAVCSLYAPALGQSDNSSGTALLGVKSTLFDVLIVRAFGGVSYERSLGSCRMGPDVRASFSVRL